MLGHVGRPGATAYNAAKGGVVNMTRSLGVACAKEGIRVNAVWPVFIETPLIADASDESLAQVIGLHSIGRLGRAEEIAAAITFYIFPHPGSVKAASRRFGAILEE
ncbi:SDR family NAD(P)-dependent oxidoreductase [Cupriavidus necator]|uniref:SDR family NAD(P)-dependent oxidoreductase n=1 Tax=Cupriavidus necator TaxID=106590 RepID=A0A1U9UPI1_CUPNE|nr:SDR family oxidoreductase [Cupriavidus necator]AQV94065.1 SDR family NAD(P)-dependent oxidoreductase [Cupriavidus necator]